MRIIHRNVVGAFIFSKDDKLLLGKSNRGTYEGCWIIPGGGIDEGETEIQALLREVMEEVGLDIEKSAIERVPGKLQGKSKKILKDSGEEVKGIYNFFVFRVNIDQNSSDIKLNEDDDFEQATWHDVKDLKNLKLAPPSLTSLKRLGYL